MRHEVSETDAGNKADSSASNSSCNDQRTYIKISEHEDDNIVEKQLKDSESSPDNKINGKVRSSVTSPPTRVFTRTSSKKNIKPELEESDVAMESSPGAERSASSDKVSSPGTANKHSLKACTHCGTTKTPLWRMGPSGPKSLCNACGIRFKKTGQPPELDTNPALTPAANQSEKSPKRKADGAVTGVLPKKCRSPTRVKKETAEVVNGVATSKNILSWRHSSGLKFAATRRSCTRRSISGTDNPLLDRTHEDDTLNRAKSKFTSSSRFRSSALRVAQDEEEGAALLLALSYGLVNA